MRIFRRPVLALLALTAFGACVPGNEEPAAPARWTVADGHTYEILNVDRPAALAADPGRPAMLVRFLTVDSLRDRHEFNDLYGYVGGHHDLTGLVYIALAGYASPSDTANAAATSAVLVDSVIRLAARLGERRPEP